MWSTKSWKLNNPYITVLFATSKAWLTTEIKFKKKRKKGIFVFGKSWTRYKINCNGSVRSIRAQPFQPQFSENLKSNFVL